jgi:hypothetical protein
VSAQLAAVYTTLLLFIGAFYYISFRAKRKAGETLRFRDFLFGALTAAKTKPVQTHVPSENRANSPHSSEYKQVLAVLEEIYHDVHVRTETAQRQTMEAMEQRIAELRAEIEVLRAEVGRLKEHAVDEHRPPVQLKESGDTVEIQAEAVPCEERSYRQGANATYYQILDELQNGKDPAQIAKELGLGVAEVEIVKRLMSIEG